MWAKWLAADGQQILLVAISSVVFYSAVILITRLQGLRSLSKISAFDFVMTVAVGSIYGMTLATPKPSLALGLSALVMLYFLQWVVASARRRWGWVNRTVDNQPTLLMVDGRFLPENMERQRVTEDDLRAKLREANVLRFDQVRAVVFETTGDISVLHGPESLEPGLLEGVANSELVSNRDERKTAST